MENRYPLPCIGDMFDLLQGAKVLSSIHLLAAHVPFACTSMSASNGKMCPWGFEVSLLCC